MYYRALFYDSFPRMSDLILTIGKAKYHPMKGRKFDGQDKTR
jgi:hypothetical protein